VFRYAIAISCACSASPSARGITWNRPIEIAAGGGQRGPWQQNDSQYDYVDDPSVALGVDGAAYVVWVDHRPKDVLLQIYEVGGKPRFAAPIDVSRTPAVFSWLPRIVLSPVNPRDVFVLWQEIVFSGGSHGGEAFFARSLDGGATFHEPVNLSRSMGGDGKARFDRELWHNGSLDLAIAADGTLHAAWTEYDGPLWYSRSSDRGESFAAPRQIAGTNEHPARAPALAVAGDRLHLAWTTGEDAAADVRIATSADAGRTFGEPVVVERTATYSDAPKLAIDAAGTLHVAYAESAGGPFERYHVRYTRSRDGARTFDAHRVIARDDEASLAAPALSLDDRRVLVLWEQAAGANTYARGLGIAMSRDGGDTFTAPEPVADSRDPGGGNNGSHQGRLMKKLDVRDGALAVVNSALAPEKHSRVWLLRGRSK
jgi:hypothetical protein